MSALNRLHKTYKQKVEFFIIYIREAHAADSRRPDPVLTVYTPRTFGERLGVAKNCRTSLGLELPMLIDAMQNSTEKAYSAWPDRLFLVDTQGKVAYRGGRGPRGFRPKELETAIKGLLATGGAMKTYTADEKKKILERLRERRKKALERQRKKRAEAKPAPAKKTSK